MDSSETKVSQEGKEPRLVTCSETAFSAIKAKYTNVPQQEIKALLDKALDLSLPPPESDADLSFFETLLILVVLFDHLDKLQETEIALRRASKHAQKLSVEPELALLAHRLLQLALTEKAGKPSESKPLFMQIYVAATKAKGPLQPLVLQVTSTACARFGKFAEAQDLARLQISSSEQSSPLFTALGRLLLGSLLLASGQWLEAASELQLTVDSATQLCGAADPLAVRAQTQLAITLKELGRLGEATRVLKEAASSAADAQSRALVQLTQAEVLLVEGSGVESATQAEAAYTVIQVSVPAGHSLSIRSLTALPVAKREPLLLAALRQLQQQSQSTCEFTVVSPLLLTLADCYASRDRLDDAEGVLRDALRLRQNWVTEDHLVNTPYLRLLAQVSVRQGKFEDAVQLGRRVVATLTKALKSDAHTFVSAVQLELASYFSANRNVAEAMALTARQVTRLITDENSVWLARALLVQAEVALAAGHFPQALQWARKAHDHYARLLSPNSARCADCLIVEGSAYMSTRAIARAEDSFQSAWNIRQQQLGYMHSDTVSAFRSLLVTLDDQDKLEEACGLLKHVLDAYRERHLQNDFHPLLVDTLYQLALHYWNLDILKQAIEYGQHALGACEGTYGSGHPLVGQIMNSLALIHEDAGDSDVAQSLMQRAQRF